MSLSGSASGGLGIDCPGDRPFVTVVMPVRNEAGYIRRSLASVFGQDYPADRMEVIVADGMSTDATRAVVRSFQAGHPNLALIDNPGRTAPAGLNRGIAMARGELVARVDGHCEIARDYLSKAVAHIQNAGVDGVGGPIETVGETRTAQAIAAAMSSSFGVGGSAFRTVKDRTLLADTIAFPVYTRAIIARAGAYDEELVRNQDDEYNYRLRKMGARLLLASDVTSRYYSRGSVGAVFRQYFQYGFWKVRVLQTHPRQMSWRQFVPPVFVASLIGTIGLAAFNPPATWMVAAVAGVYLIASLAASVRAASTPSQFVILPVVFAAIHAGYGLGFLAGLARFAGRW